MNYTLQQDIDRRNEVINGILKFIQKGYKFTIAEDNSYIVIYDNTRSTIRKFLFRYCDINSWSPLSWDTFKVVIGNDLETYFVNLIKVKKLK